MSALPRALQAQRRQRMLVQLLRARPEHDGAFQRFVLRLLGVTP